MRNLFNVVFALAGLVLLSACSSIVEGRSEEIVINTNPSAASCTLVRNDVTIGSVDPTPGSILIEKTKYDMVIKCNKDGYEEATYFNKSGIDEWTFGNIAFGGLIGWGIDSATGSDNKYDSPVNITLPLAKSDQEHAKHRHQHHVKAPIAKDASDSEAKPAPATATSPSDYPSDNRR